MSDPQGPVGHAEWLILMNATAIMLVVVLPVIALTFAFAWRYRASNMRAAYTPDWSYSGKIELVVWSIPAMVVLLLAGVGWIGSHRLDPARALEAAAKPLRIEVVSLDWKWLFIYPDEHVGSLNELTVPAATPLQFELTSATVMNSFFIPQLGSQIYTMAGMTTHLNLLAARPGEYWGESAHFSGDGFSNMRFAVHALAPAAFAAWLARTRATAPPLDVAAYLRLARAAATAPAQSYGSIDAALFGQALRAAVQGAATPPGVH